MEGEIHNFIVVWTIVLASLCYSHTIAKFIPKGKSRFVAIIPIVCLFYILPLYLTSINLGATTSFFITGLATFKLILFAFGKGPLSSTPPLPLSTFIPLACLPIKLKKYSTSDNVETKKKTISSTFNLVTKIALLAILIRVYNHKENLHPKFILFCYCLHIYFMLEIMLNIVSIAVRVVSRVELEPAINNPHLASSLQDFWGKRWNLMVTNILRPTVYDPIHSMVADRISRKWAPLPAVIATFFVSGLMHELIFYYNGRLKPNGEVMMFFLIHGVALSLEIVIKKIFNGKFLVPRIISGPLALSFIIFTSFWLFFPPFLRGNTELKACTEFIAFLEFIRYGKLINPTNITCPLL
ncbi:acyl-CoA--sterol O-acyltransferase 1-like isoform X2 [Solanum stenotomum]|uniref:acyl-CoA--sterol O-acyltransferase 1-like isoform X2 n=1 Tax=Solanum stenotomum TaxID=172797 RepID=UPI0020D1619A|nr:acyl-CoA--sterol O-acyltransferase 1-like isoform X2 [Solanum stenotomum]